MDDVALLLLMTLLSAFLVWIVWWVSKCQAHMVSDTSYRCEKDVQQTIRALHANLQLRHGTFKDELPEQLMAVRYIRPHDVVLELGGNIGRNSLVIASLLKNPRNLVSLETDPEIARQLDENRRLNGLPFQIVVAALSARRLIQSGWNTKPLSASETIPDGWKEIDTCSYKDLCEMTSRPFTTLVADCEGALFYILRDFPEMLASIQTVIMENDYTDLSHKEEVDSRLRGRGFECVYREAGGWGPCYDRFFEVWQKRK